MKPNLKRVLYFLVGLFLLYSLVWFKLALGLSSIINETFSEKTQEIHDNYRIKFAKSSITGFPFSIGVKIHNLVEDTTMASVEHADAVSVAYNIFSQRLIVSYDGKSYVRYKPLESKFGIDLSGKYEWYLKAPLNLRIIKFLWKGEEDLSILTSLQGVSWKLSNVLAHDIVDNAQIMNARDMAIDFSIKHHKSYTNLEEFKNDIPKDYNIKIDIDTEYSDKANPKPIPPSIVYGFLLPLSLNDKVQAHIHTDANKFNFTEIMGKLKIKLSENIIQSNIQDRSTNLEFSSNVENNDMEYSIDYSSNILLKDGYKRELNKIIKVLSDISPSIPYVSSIRGLIQTIDFSHLDLDTNNEPIILNFKGAFSEQDKQFKLNLSEFGVKIKDAGFLIQNKSNTDASLKNWSSEGVISVSRWPSVFDYLLKSYYSVMQVPSVEPFGKEFYTKVINDFINKVVNEINPQYEAITINYKFSEDIPKSQIGKLSLPEFGLLYYATLLKHINLTLNDQTKAIEQFKKIVPSYIAESDSLDKIIQQSKE